MTSNSNVMTTTTELTRREMIGAMAMAGTALLFTNSIATATARHAHGAEGNGPILVQELPPISLDGWRMTALEITYAPGQIDHAHKHIGFVFGYVLEGDLRFKADGGEETIYHTGQLFYEQPGTVHRVSANASSSKACRFLATVFAEKSTPLSVPV